MIHKASDVKPPPLPAIEESAASEFAPVPSQGVSVPPFSGGFTPPPAPVAAEARRQNLPTDEPLADEKDEIPAWLRSILNRFTLRETPSWLTSLMVHLAIILLLAIIPLSEKIGSSITIFSGAADSEGDDELPVMDVSASEDSSDTTDSLADQLNIEAVSVESLTVPVPEVNMDLKVDSAISGGLKGRTGAMKEALLKAYGGTAGTEEAVAMGLAWLAKQQRSDGSWSLVGPFRGGAASENKPAATAMALIAFLGAGNTHEEGEYQANVKKGIQYILSLQDEDGFFAQKAVGNQRTYAQAQCTIAVCELYGMTGDPKLVPAATKAIEFAQQAQAKNGGWRYQPKEPGDMSVTGWYVMALMSARMGGLTVDSEVLENVHQFLDLVQRSARGNKRDPEGERYAYQAFSTGTPAMTAEGMLCRLYLGWNATDKRILAGSDMLCENPVSRAPNRISFYYWYYATTTLHHLGGSYWRRWNDEMKVELPALQEKSGPNRGSWSAEEDPHEAGGGRLYATCFAIYCLETYYRHLPLNRMTSEE